MKVIRQHQTVSVQRKINSPKRCTTTGEVNVDLTGFFSKRMANFGAEAKCF